MKKLYLDGTLHQSQRNIVSLIYYREKYIVLEILRIHTLSEDLQHHSQVQSM